MDAAQFSQEELGALRALRNGTLIAQDHSRHVEEGGKEESVCLWSKKGVNQQGCQGASRTEGY